MQASYRWIKEILNQDIAAQEMIDMLISLGHEIEGVVDLGFMGNPIRIARVESVEPHPDPEVENLSICVVDDGQDEKATVVCGAPNVAAGQIAVLARSGATLPGGKTLRKTKIRGAASEGMLLALDEMGLGTDHSGILVLDDDAPVGEGYDVLLTVELTPNRPDCLSMRGLARELAAAMDRKVYTERVRLRETFESVHDLTNISVKCHEACPRYTARVVKGVAIKPSPHWMQRRLLACGLRPINNVVDATNYALLELGHPLHAFDYDRLAENRIVVRMAEEGEKLTIIDGSEVELQPGKDMVIADAKQAVALAGVMGGLDSEVQDDTTNLLIESAYFDPTTIRRTSRYHHISTDASYRFERGANVHAVTEALDRVTELIVETSGGEVPKGIIDTQPHPSAPAQIMFRPSRAQQVLGAEISKMQMADLLSALGFEILRSDTDLIVLSVPPWRVDIEREEDMFEEIARLHGYGNIAPTMPYLPASTQPMNAGVALCRAVQDRMVALGFQDTIHLSFIGSEQLEQLGVSSDGLLKLQNPLSRELDSLRPLLAPSMISTLLRNANYGNASAALFEVAGTFHFGDMAAPTVEKPALSIGCMGACRPQGWQGASPDWDFFRLKGVVESLLSALGTPSPKVVPSDQGLLHPGRAASVTIKGKAVGWFGELSPLLRRRLGFKNRPLIGELELDALAPFVTDVRRAVELPRFPAVERDLAIVVDASVRASDLETSLREAAGNLLESVELFDCYEGAQVPEGKKSLAYRLVYRHAERTLTDEEVDAAREGILAALAERYQATLRQ